jgi:hypothetical protein
VQFSHKHPNRLLCNWREADLYLIACDEYNPTLHRHFGNALDFCQVRRGADEGYCATFVSSVSWHRRAGRGRGWDCVGLHLA